MSRQRSILIVLAAFSFAGVALAVQPALPVIPTGTFNLTNYGGNGNGTFDNTTAMQNTINAIGSAGGGTLVIPAGTFLCGPVTLTNNLRVQLDSGAVLKLLPYGTYPGGTSPPDFMTISRGHDIEFSGPGVINGQGQAWWDANLDISLKPYLISFDKMFQRLWFHGLTMTNTPMKHIVIDGIGGDVLIEDLFIFEDGNSPNTDGINLQGTNCLVRNCNISAGDDNIAMGRSSGPGADILITNITCGTGHGISIGSITSAGESNITVVNCSFTGTDFGLRLKANNSKGGLVQNIVYHDITVTNVGVPIYIYSYYDVSGTGSPQNIGKINPTKAATFAPEAVVANTPVWRNITFSNITGSGAYVGTIIWGRPEMLVSNVTLQNINITAPQMCNIYNARGVTFVDSQFSFQSNYTYGLFNAQVVISNSSPTGVAPITLDGLTQGSTNNELALYNTQPSLSNTNLFGNPLRLTLGGGTLHITNNLSLTSTNALTFVLGTNAATIAVTGNLKLTGTNNIIAGVGFGAGVYTLFTCGGTLTSNAIVLGSTPAGYNYSLSTNTAGQLRLTVTALAPPPLLKFGGISLSNGNIFLTGTNGPAGSNCFLLATTNLALPLSNWTRLATNQFDAYGNLLCINSRDSNIMRQFYRLQTQ